MEPKVLRISAEVEKLHDVLAFVDALLEENDCPMKARTQIDVALEELFVNIAHYAYPEGTGDAEIRVCFSDGYVEITLIDGGIPYDPLAKPDPDVTLSAEERQIGGLGIFMTKKLMDDISYMLSDISIPDSVTIIGYNAFYGCRKLTGISIPDSVTRIESGTFSDCTSLTTAIIGNSVTFIGEYAFYNCVSLTSIDIPDSVSVIEQCAFESCKNLTSIDIPDNVSIIDRYTFSHCKSLTSVKIGNSVASIGGDAFYNCVSLTSIDIPDSVKTIGGKAFYDCTSLSSATISNSVTFIGEYAFYNCENLENVTIPASVTSIRDKALGYNRDVDFDTEMKVSGFTIYGYKDTEAERYASDNGFIFIPLEEPSTLGDADGDGEVTILDATAIQRKLASLPTASFDEKAADADGDDEITILDATAIQRHLASLPTNENIGKTI